MPKSSFTNKQYKTLFYLKTHSSFKKFLAKYKLTDYNDVLNLFPQNTVDFVIEKDEYSKIILTDSAIKAVEELFKSQTLFYATVLGVIFGIVGVILQIA